MKFLKDKKIQIVGMTEGYCDDEGVYHKGGVAVLGELWAHVQGANYEQYFAAGVQWDKPRLTITVTRPAFDISLEHYVKYKDDIYDITAIDLLEDMPHSDIKLSVEFDRDNQGII